VGGRWVCGAAAPAVHRAGAAGDGKDPHLRPVYAETVSGRSTLYWRRRTKTIPVPVSRDTSPVHPPRPANGVGTPLASSIEPHCSSCCMIADLFYPYGAAVLVVIAVIPGLIIWWSGRALARDLDDPALPDRLAARRQRHHGPAVGIVIAIILFGWPSAAYWGIPLTIMTSMAGGFPLRKALYSETWGILGYLSLMVRASIAFFGFWLSLAFMPEL